jgi:hypothetical protein
MFYKLSRRKKMLHTIALVTLYSLILVMTWGMWSVMFVCVEYCVIPWHMNGREMSARLFSLWINFLLICNMSMFKIIFCIYCQFTLFIFWNALFPSQLCLQMFRGTMPRMC